MKIIDIVWARLAVGRRLVVSLVLQLPNQDTFYGSGYFDLSNGPCVLQVSRLRGPIRSDEHGSTLSLHTDEGYARHD